MTNHSARRWSLTAVTFLLLLSLTGCTPAAQPTAMTPAASSEAPQAAATQETGVYQLITAEQAKKIMDTETDITILDVREPSEFNEGHIPNAKLLPLGDIATLAATSLPDLNAKILVYCRSGRRSQNAAKQLIALGYTQVLDFGGILNWPYDVVQ